MKRIKFKMNRIKFKEKTTISNGRNGTIQTIGVEIYKSPPMIDESNKVYECIRIFPITSYDKAGNCWIEIPTSEIQNFIKQLIEHDQSTTT